MFYLKECLLFLCIWMSLQITALHINQKMVFSPPTENTTPPPITSAPPTTTSAPPTTTSAPPTTTSAPPTTTTAGKKNCVELGGTCNPKNSSCCPNGMSFDPELCDGTSTQVCCLPLDSEAASGSNHTSTCSNGGICSLHHKNVLCDAIDAYTLNSDGVAGFGLADTDTLITGGCAGGCLSIEPGYYCDPPTVVCLKKRILNLIECFPNACSGQHKWLLYNLLNVYFDTEICDGNHIILKQQPGQESCSIDKFTGMCEDVGGVATEEASDELKCILQ